MSTSVGVSCTGTLKCFSSRAAADEAMGLLTLTVEGSGCGMAILWEQAGHWICVPAREASASSSCLQFGQTNITSIITSLLGLTGEKVKVVAENSSEKFTDRCVRAVSRAGKWENWRAC